MKNGLVRLPHRVCRPQPCAIYECPPDTLIRCTVDGDPKRVFFLAAIGNDDPGLYGWGVVTKIPGRNKKISFRPLPPSDYLKADPIWNKKVEKAIDKIRGKVKQGTMWRIEKGEMLVIRNLIRPLGTKSA